MAEPAVALYFIFFTNSVLVSISSPTNPDLNHHLAVQFPFRSHLPYPYMAAQSSSCPRGTIAEVRQLPELPTVPAQYAPHSEVQCFLTKYFQIKAEMSETEARKMASKMRVDGDVLFSQNEKVLKDIYPIYGSGLYNHIHASDYGLVSKFI